MDTTTNLDELNAAIATKRAELTALETQRREQQLALARVEEAARNADAFAAIATEVGSTPEHVGAFLVKVAERSGFGVDYLVNEISTERPTWSGVSGF